MVNNFRNMFEINFYLTCLHKANCMYIKLLYHVPNQDILAKAVFGVQIFQLRN